MRSNLRAYTAGTLLLIATATLVAFGMPIALVAATTLTTMFAVIAGGLLPILIHLYVRSFRHRPDPRQWRWGVSIYCIFILTMAFIDGRVVEVMATGTTIVQACYAAGKYGCYQLHCCQAVPYRVVNARTSLPHFEASLSLALFVVCLSLTAAGEFHSSVASGMTGHAVLRAMAYWARGNSFSLASVRTTPDLVAVSILVLSSAIYHK